MTYDEEIESKTINIDDDKVKDRWSRYIGAMGIDAVAKQANSRIFLNGLAGLGIEIAKNIVLAGCKEITINDVLDTDVDDMSDNFFITKEDIGKNRAGVCKKKLQQLNLYVKVTITKMDLTDVESYKKLELEKYDVVVLTEAMIKCQTTVNDYC